MLVLQDIVKNYFVGDEIVQALNSVSCNFRKSEFVSILGPSGCGKTTLLNIIGGLDRYTTGNLIINGKSTKDFTNKDWDTYRNHSIGFVFQNYNLIPHQTVLANVELALTLSGVSKDERRKRAISALERVGLGNQLKKKPNQMSGGQMQRVAIARALVNDPDILLADEPTGALDSQTSVQVMDILKEIAKDKLVIMVTHNAELAKEYSSRIIRLKDGEIVDDSNPYSQFMLEHDEALEKSQAVCEKDLEKKKKSMSFFTALLLSFNNLMTKKGRTILTAFAGSIGIIGIALILSLSNGFQKYIDKVQEDTLSAYPVTIKKESSDLSSMLEAFGSTQENNHDVDDKIYSNSTMMNLLSSLTSLTKAQNNLAAFKSYVEMNRSQVESHVSTITYSYNLDLLVYSANTSDGISRVNPSSIVETLVNMIYGSETSSIINNTSILNIFCEIMPGLNGEYVSDMLKEQYDVVAGEWPDEKNELVLIVNEKNEVSDLVLYALGLKNQNEFYEMLQSWQNPSTSTKKVSQNQSWDFDTILNMEYSLILPTDVYELAEEGTYIDNSNNKTIMSLIVGNGMKLKFSGIIRPSKNATATALSGSVGFTNELMLSYIDQINNTDIVKKQLNNPEIDVFTGKPFAKFDDTSKESQIATIIDYVNSMSASEKEKYYVEFLSIPTEEIINQQIEALSQNEAEMFAIREQIIDYYVKAGYNEELARSTINSLTNEQILNNKIIREMVVEEIKQKYAQTVSEELASLPNKDQALDELMIGLPAKSADEVAFYYDFYVKFRRNNDQSITTYQDNLAKLGYVDLDNPSEIRFYPIVFNDKDAISEFIAEYNRSVSDDDKISYTDYISTFLSGISIIIDAISYVLIGFVSISLVVSSIMIGIITYISVLERTKEIGILRAIGASKRDVSRVFNAETLIVGFIAGMLGIIVSVILCLPITLIIQHLAKMQGIKAELPVAGGIALVLISMLLTVIAGLIPSKLASKKDPVEALRTE